MPIEETWHVVCRECELEEIVQGDRAVAHAYGIASEHQADTGHRTAYGQIEEGETA